MGYEEGEAWVVDKMQTGYPRYADEHDEYSESNPHSQIAQVLHPQVYPKALSKHSRRPRQHRNRVCYADAIHTMCPSMQGLYQAREQRCRLLHDSYAGLCAHSRAHRIANDQDSSSGVCCYISSNSMASSEGVLATHRGGYFQPTGRVLPTSVR